MQPPARRRVCPSTGRTRVRQASLFQRRKVRSSIVSRGITLGFAAYPVADIGRAIAFYRDTVGLGEATVMNDDYAEFDLGNAAFGLDASTAALGVEPGSAFSAA